MLNPHRKLVAGPARGVELVTHFRWFEGSWSPKTLPNRRNGVFVAVFRDISSGSHIPMAIRKSIPAPSVLLVPLPIFPLPNAIARHDGHRPPLMTRKSAPLRIGCAGWPQTIHHQPAVTIGIDQRKAATDGTRLRHTQGRINRFKKLTKSVPLQVPMGAHASLHQPKSPENTSRSQPQTLTDIPNIKTGEKKRQQICRDRRRKDSRSSGMSRNEQQLPSPFCWAWKTKKRTQRTTVRTAIRDWAAMASLNPLAARSEPKTPIPCASTSPIAGASHAVTSRLPRVFFLF